MGKKQKNRPDESSAVSKIKSSLNITRGLQEETKFAILSVVFFVLAIFFAFASMGRAGAAGTFAFKILHNLFGAGYVLFPIVFVLGGISFLRSIRPHIIATTISGSVLLLAAGLGIVDIIFASRTETITGGMIGHLVAIPALSLFGEMLGIIVLTAIGIASVLIIFDTKITLDPKIFGKRLFSDEEWDSEDPEETKTEIKEDNPKVLNQGEQTTQAALAAAKNDTSAAAKESAKSVKKLVTDKINELIPMEPTVVGSFADYVPPPLSLLERDSEKPTVGDIKANSNIIKRTLLNFGIDVEMDEISIGPSITRYALKPAEGVKISRIVALLNDLSLALAAHPLRIEAPIPGRSLVGIEIPNTVKATVRLGSLLASKKFVESDKPLLVPLGKGTSGIPHFADVAKAPHLLIAGATGSGKSVTIHTIITALLYRNSPDNLKLILIDPKRVELTLYGSIPHLLTPVITEPKRAILALKWVAKEMERRYEILEKCAVRDIQSYHKNIFGKQEENPEKDGSTPHERMPYIVIIIDELADIMTMYPKELESSIVRIAQMARAVGIHLILSTQRPSVEVITGLIKANVPSRIALQVPSQIDSRTILDMAGAEKLLGAGDMLYLSGELSKPQRIQSAFISEAEVKRVTDFLRNNVDVEAQPESIDFTEVKERDVLFSQDLDGDGDADAEDEAVYEEARDLVIRSSKASTSYLQRKLKLGYARAARIIDMLEERGVIGRGEGAKPREVIIKYNDEALGIENSDNDTQEINQEKPLI
jgi:S-DNA-T family DNA segregation ATPase FtsK/SpoIIIE